MITPSDIAPRAWNFGATIMLDRREIALADALSTARAWHAKGLTYHYAGDFRRAALCRADAELLESVARAAEQSRRRLGWREPTQYDEQRFGRAG